MFLVNGQTHARAALHSVLHTLADTKPSHVAYTGLWDKATGLASTHAPEIARRHLPLALDHAKLGAHAKSADVLRDAARLLDLR